MRDSGFRLFWVVIVIGALFVVRTQGNLPDTVAIDFGTAGAPNAWISRAQYIGYLVVIGFVIPLLLVTLLSRRAATSGSGWWLGSLIAGFALGIHAVILGAHRMQPPRLSTTGFLVVAGLFVIGLVSWALRWARAARPPT
jgi:hypothetical protein